MGIQEGCVMGFDASTNVLDYFTSMVISQGGGSASGSGIAIGSGGRNSTSALICTLHPTFNSANVRAIKTLPGPLSTIFQTFPFTFNRFPTTGNSIILLELRDSGTTQIDVRLFPDGHLKVTRNGTVLATSTFIVVANQFYHAELKAVIDPSAGVIDIKINEASAFGGEITGLNTRNTANSQVTEIVVAAACLGSESSASGDIVVKFDDLVTRDDAYSGNCRVREDLPTGTGSVDDGVPTGDTDTRHCVDDTTPDGDTTRSALVTVGHKFRLTYPAIPSDSIVLALIPKFYASTDAAGPAGFKANLLIGATEYTPGSEKSPSDGSYQYFSDVLEVSPDTAVAFTPAEVNALELGAEKTT